MSILKKLLNIPSGETVQVEAHDTWRVRWYAVTRCAKGLGSSKPQVEVFPSREDAIEFSVTLKDAAKLLMDTESKFDAPWGPWVEKNEYKGI